MLIVVVGEERERRKKEKRDPPRFYNILVLCREWKLRLETRKERRGLWKRGYRRENAGPRDLVSSKQMKRGRGFIIKLIVSSFFAFSSSSNTSNGISTGGGEKRTRLCAYDWAPILSRCNVRTI